MKIAIIGSGIAGMTCAHYLQHEHEITVFEAGNYIGGHTNTHEFELDGRSYAIDTGFIVLNDRTYPNFRKLLGEIGVATQPAPMSFSLQCSRTGLEYRGADLNGMFAQRKNIFSPRFLKLIWDLVKFGRIAEQRLGNAGDEITVDRFFAENRFGKGFREQYFYPMASAIWSCPNRTIGSFPVRFIVDFYRHHGLLGVSSRPQWYVIRGGSRRYVEALTAPVIDRFRINTPVLSVRRGKETVSVRTSAGEESFDHVIFACHSDQALRILADSATSREQELLTAFQWQANDAVLHTDESILPRQRRAWAAWNYHLADGEAESATLTYWMNLLQTVDSPHNFCVSLNCIDRIDPSKILYRATYHHPVFSTRRADAQSRHQELIGPNRTSFCGAYWRNGFHEDGVISALRVCKNLVSTGISVEESDAAKTEMAVTSNV